MLSVPSGGEGAAWFPLDSSGCFSPSLAILSPVHFLYPLTLLIAPLFLSATLEDWELWNT